jgi:hypothetical protein
MPVHHGITGPQVFVTVTGQPGALVPEFDPLAPSSRENEGAT